jgi:hypothetical protein
VYQFLGRWLSCAELIAIEINEKVRRQGLSSGIVLSDLLDAEG